MDNRKEIERIIEISKQYYLQNLSQEEISKNFSLSRPSISRLLDKAIKEGYVNISIVDPFEVDAEVANQLQQALNINKVIVVPAKITNEKALRKYIAIAAAKYIEEVLLPGDIVGIGFGQTLFEISERIEPSVKEDIIFVPLIGGLGQVEPIFQVHTITEKFCNAFNGKSIQYFMPGVVETIELHNQLIMSNEGQKVRNYWRKMTKAIIGVGGNPQDVAKNYRDSIKEFENIPDCAVSDVCMRFIDINGCELDILSQQILSIEYDLLKNVPEVIVVACGMTKVNGIIGASRGKIVNTLITDETTAQAVLNRLKESGTSE